MKPNHILLTFSIFFLSLLTIEAQNSANDKGAKFIRDFYTSYITVCDNMPMKLDEITNIKIDNCTSELINRLTKLDLDYDPFLDSQDCSKNWVKTIKVKSLKNIELGYEVTYETGYMNQIASINISLVKLGRTYKVNEIIGLTDK